MRRYINGFMILIYLQYMYTYIILLLKIKHSTIKCCRLCQHQKIRFLENRTPKASHNGI